MLDAGHRRVEERTVWSVCRRSLKVIVMVITCNKQPGLDSSRLLAVSRAEYNIAWDGGI